MTKLIIQLAIGIVLIIIGINNMKGNISSLHSYHRKRVKKEDIIPFGKLVGIGSIIIGTTVIIAGIIFLINELISSIIIGVGLTIGIIIIFYALIKYNKGIF